jgi:hypothetical protein
MSEGHMAAAVTDSPKVTASLCSSRLFFMGRTLQMTPHGPCGPCGVKKVNN